MLTATTMRHGDDSHVMRPDRIIRTGVVMPTGNYQPVSDMQEVATEFTRIFGPSGTGLAGAVGNWFARTKQRMQVAKTVRAQKKLLKHYGVSGLGYVQQPPWNSSGHVPGAPDFLRPGDVANSLMNQNPGADNMPSPVQPILVAAARRVPWEANAPQRMVNELIPTPGWVGQRARAGAMAPWTAKRKLGWR